MKIKTPDDDFDKDNYQGCKQNLLAVISQELKRENESHKILVISNSVHGIFIKFW